RSSRPIRGDRGAAAAELALVVPVLVMIIGLVVAGGRLWLARQAVEDAAAGAARAASLARSPVAARQAAQEVVRSNVRTHGLDCLALDVAVDPSGFGRSPGAGGTVDVSVSCTVGLSDVVVPGLPGSTELTADGRSALDTYRGRR
uniref:TadE/TadG family type IV pilus assembly protein n=1 Tax=Desertihabitans aurantiacus TaxID=2282477 RepID=UPI000DF7A9AF